MPVLGPIPPEDNRGLAWDAKLTDEHQESANPNTLLSYVCKLVSRLQDAQHQLQAFEEQNPWVEDDVYGLHNDMLTIPKGLEYDPHSDPFNDPLLPNTDSWVEPPYSDSLLSSLNATNVSSNIDTTMRYNSDQMTRNSRATEDAADICSPSFTFETPDEQCPWSDLTSASSISRDGSDCGTVRDRTTLSDVASRSSYDGLTSAGTRPETLFYLPAEQAARDDFLAPVQSVHNNTPTQHLLTDTRMSAYSATPAPSQGNYAEAASGSPLQDGYDSTDSDAELDTPPLQHATHKAGEGTGRMPIRCALSRKGDGGDIVTCSDVLKTDLVQIKEHLRECHKGFIPSSIDFCPYGDCKCRKKDGDLPTKCTLGTFARHVYDIHMGLGISCPSCGKACRDIWDLKRHMKSKRCGGASDSESPSAGPSGSAKCKRAGEEEPSGSTPLSNAQASGSGGGKDKAAKTPSSSGGKAPLKTANAAASSSKDAGPSKKHRTK